MSNSNMTPQDGKITKMVTLNVMGKRVRLPFTGTPEQHAELIAGQREFAADKRRHLKLAQRATGTDKIKAVAEYMYDLSSEKRIAALLPLIEHEPADVFWPNFIAWWPSCDCAWAWNERLVKIFRRVGPCRDYAWGIDYGEFYESLPDTITVYRGASRSRIKGAISWTTSINAARRFARGHRGISVPDPVVATGVIDKASVFLALNERHEENEILALPRVIKVEDFVTER